MYSDPISPYRERVPSVSHSISSPQWPKYLFAVSIILGVGGLCMAGSGLAGYLGALNHLGHAHSIILMVSGGLIGTIFLIAGTAGLLKSCRHNPYQFEPSLSESGNTSPQSMMPSRLDRASPVVEKSHLQEDPPRVYGAATWKKALGVEILDEIPPLPPIDWNKPDLRYRKPFQNNYVFLYLPKMIYYKSQERKVSRELFDEISGFKNFKTIEDHYNVDASVKLGCWVLIGKKLVDRWGTKVDSSPTRLPYVLEAYALNVLEIGLNGSSLLDDTYTLCTEKDKENDELFIGSFSKDDKDYVLDSNETQWNGSFGVLPVYDIRTN